MREPAEMEIICIDVTNRCDLQCSNCTRLLANQKRRWDMTLDNWRLALQSLEGYPGVIAMIGGNPCLHPQFEALCDIFVEEIPEQRQRGLWTNNVFKHQEVIARTFGVYNLNPHGDRRGIESLKKLVTMVPGIGYYEGQSHHAPLLTAIKDLEPDEGRMWDAISRCDINRNWSASIVQNAQGELRAYFCEVAASFDLARGEDHGKPLSPEWWCVPLIYGDDTKSVLGEQVKHFCPGCGAAARLQGRLDSEDTDDFTASNADIATRTRGKRKVVELKEPVPSEHAVTDYAAGMRGYRMAERTTLSVVIPAFNASTTIGETIDSVLDQHMAPNMVVDIIVVDDCSFDGTPQFVATYGAGIGAITLLVQPENAGPAAARNRGLRASKSDYVMFLDADDVLVQGALWVALHTLSQQKGLAAVITDVELVNAHREVLPAQLNAMVWSMPSNMVVRRSVCELLDGFPEDVAFRGRHASEDMIFKQTLSSMFRVGWIRFPFLKYRCHSGSHLDVFLDTTYVEDGELRYSGGLNDAVDVAAAVYMTRARLRVEEIEGSRDVEAPHVVVIDVKRTLPDAS